MSKWFKSALSLVIVAFLLWYLVRHWGQLNILLKLKPKQIAAMYFLCFMIALASARVVQCLVDVLKTKTRFWDMVWLHNAALLLNYVPMKFGTLFRANYLKRHYGLGFTHFATFFLYITFLMIAVATTMGLIALLIVYGLSGYENQILGGVFLIALVGSLILLLIPLPEPMGKGRLSTTLRNFLSGRRRISSRKRTVFISAALLALNSLLTALRIGIVYHSLGQELHPAGCLILGTLGFVVLFIGLTPGSLGIRELVLSAGAVVLGVSLEVGILAAMIDRAITISYAFVVGGGCAMWLWRKSPADFKDRRSSSIDQ